MFFGGFSQQIPLNNQYLVNSSSLIPAFSGYHGNIESFLTYRQSWLGIDGAPKTALLNVNGILAPSMGFGFTALTDKTGNYGQSFISATYSYHLSFGDNIALNAAISPLFYRNQLNLSSIQSYGTQLDPMLSNTDALSINAFDVGVSLGFCLNGLKIGVSVPQTIGMSFKFNEIGDNFKLRRHYFLYSSYEIITGDFSFQPSVVVRSTEKFTLNYAAGVKVKYKDRVWTNLGYGSDNSILLSVGVLSGSSLALNYSYEFGIAGLSSASLGTHEITLGFLIKPAQNHNSYATVFLPIESIVGEVDENLTNKVAMLDQQLKSERQERIAGDEKMQEKIDSLANLIGTGVVADNNNAPATQWVQRISTQSINFGLMNDVIFSSSFGELDKYSQKLRQDTELKIKILVYTDNQFSESVNKQLSHSRAKSVADYFLSKPGITPNQVFYEGMGSIDPVADNTTPEGREKNNRVEFLFNKKVF